VIVVAHSRPRSPARAAERLRAAGWLIFAGLQWAGTSPALAQLSGRVSADSQYRLRGYAIAEAHPVATATIGYDDKSGAYANATMIASTHDGDVGVAGYLASIGYAGRLSSSVSIDAGVQRTQYARTAGEPMSRHYTEAYAGVTVRGVTARAYYSPDYFVAGRHTLYTEIEGNLRPAEKWNFNLHLGALTYLSDPPRWTARSRYDWRATVSRNLGRFEVYAALSGRGPGGDYYVRNKGRAVVTAGAAFAF
jgi:uncharacterized protein (TIGR02001 family)